MSAKVIPINPRARLVAVIPVGNYVEGEGWRVSFVVEGERGHRPTGTWPYEGKPGQSAPWFWGHSFDAAKAMARDYNRRAGISDEDAFKIVMFSMGGSR